MRTASESIKLLGAADPVVMRGQLVRSSAGAQASVNPLIWVANAAAKNMNRFAVELGMTPASRVGLEGSDTRPRKFEGLLAG